MSSVRRAALADVADLVDLARDMHEDSSFAPLQFDPDKLTETLAVMIRHGHGVFVAELRGEIVGAIVGYLDSPIFSRDKVAYEHALYVSPEHRSGHLAISLVSAFADWAKQVGAKQIRPGVTTGPVGGGACKLYRAMGFTPVGETFLRNLHENP